MAKISEIKNNPDCSLAEYAELLRTYRGKSYVNEWGAYIGGPEYPGPHNCMNTEVNRDSFKHICDALGDLNPLYRDEDYSKNTKYGTLVAPPCWPYSIAYGCFPEVMFPKFGSLYTGDNIEWYLPAADGDVIDWRTTFPTDISEGCSDVHGDVIVTKGVHEFKRRQGGLELCRHEFTTTHFEMDKSAYKTSFDPSVAPEYTEECIREVYEAQDNEKVQGAETRFWEDVAVGEKLTPVVRGPLTVMESASWLNVAAQGLFVSDRFYRTIHKNTGLGYYHPDLKVWFNFQEPIFDDWGSFAKQVGSWIPGGYASQRSAWAMMMLSNWMGDEGFLWKFRANHVAKGGYHRIFWTRGVVKDKGQGDGRFWVDVDFTVADHTGREITVGDARVLLRSRDAGGVLYPRPAKPFGAFFK